MTPSPETPLEKAQRRMIEAELALCVILGYQESPAVVRLMDTAREVGRLEGEAAK